MKKRNKVTMMRLSGQQQGGSIIANIFFLALLVYGVFIGIQYVPQLIESKSIGSILRSIHTDEKIEKNTNERRVSDKLVRLLQMNEMDYMRGSYTVQQYDGKVTIKFSYERELDLIYKMQKIHYERTMVLN
jgi:hypothetical protein